MRADRKTTIGARGEIQVVDELLGFGWGPVRTDPESDLGTDIYAQIRDETRFDIGLLLSFQVKTGASWFARPAKVEGRDGWWHAEEDNEHFEAWVRHTIPHVLVLRDLNEGRSYWCQVTREAVDFTGKGSKIFVPKDQLLDESHRTKLITIAAAQRTKQDIEGSAWVSNRQRRYSPMGGLRHALICPRVVAPHPNQTTQEIDPIEASALCTLGRTQEFDILLRRRKSRPKTLEDAHSSPDFRWRFAAHVRVAANYYVFFNPNSLVTEAFSPHFRTASAVCAAVSLSNSENYAGAIEVLDGVLDESDGVDRAWLLVQRARFRVETGDVASAQEDAVQAQQAAALFADDLTASAISGAAAVLLFRTAGWWSNDSLQAVVSSTDTAASWWREGLVVAGLAKWSNTSFKKWVDDRSVTIGASDTAALRLRSALWLSDFAAEQDAWQANLNTYGKYLLVSSDGSVDRISVALDLIRRSGSKKDTRLAAHQVWRTGPLEALSNAVTDMVNWKWPSSSTESNIALLEEAADVMDLEQRRSFYVEITGALEARPSARIKVENVVERMDLVKSLTELLRVSGELELHRDAGRFIAEFVVVPGLDQGTLQALSMTLGVLRLAHLDDDSKDKLRTVARGASIEQVVPALLALFSSSEQWAADRIAERARENDSDALGKISREAFRASSSFEDATKMVRAQADELMRIRREAREDGSHPPDAPEARTLALLSIDYPDVAEWASIAGFIGDDAVPTELKRDVCVALAPEVNKVDEATRHLLQEATLELTKHRFSIGMMLEPLAGGAEQLLMALGLQDDDAVITMLLRLMRLGWRERRDAAAALSYWSSETAVGTLTALAVDSHPTVRSTATLALAEHMSDGLVSGTTIDGLLSGELGALVPMQFLQSIANRQMNNEINLPPAVLEGLKSHASASVRMNAHRV